MPSTRPLSIAPCVKPEYEYSTPTRAGDEGNSPLKESTSAELSFRFVLLQLTSTETGKCPPIFASIHTSRWRRRPW
jgi:hypothetical protein